MEILNNNNKRSKRPSYEAEAMRCFADSFGLYHTAMCRVAQMYQIPGYDIAADTIMREMEQHASFLYRSGVRYLNRFNRELNN